MEVVLDSDTLNHQLRQNRPSKKSPRGTRHRSILERRLDDGTLRLVVDDLRGGLVSQWEDTCGRSHVRVFVVHWLDRGRFTIKIPKGLPQGFYKLLCDEGFKDDAIDKLILKLAYATSDKTVISDDSDFWRPGVPREKGNRNAPIPRLCRDHLSVTIRLIASFA